MNKEQLAKTIDQTLLKADATEEQVTKFIQDAKPYGFASICINQVYVPLARRLLEGTETKVCTVIDFPLGAGGTEAKITQSVLAVKQGADEVDFVVDIGLVKAHAWDKLTSGLSDIVREIKAVSDEVGRKIVTKLILETCLLSDDEITQSSICARNSGFDFVKTSTGFSTGGATAHAVKLMREAVGSEMGVKASGGIHSTEEALLMIENGATRIGASAGAKIVDGFKD